MDKKYEFCSFQICPFEITGESTKLYHPLRDKYPYRNCIFDEENRKVIDIDLEMQYDYVEMSLMYFIGKEASRIEENKRYAILKLAPFYYDDKIIKKAQAIREKLMHGYIFQDGNDINNEQYLSIVNSKKDKKVKQKSKLR